MPASSQPAKREHVLDVIAHRETGRIPYMILFQSGIASKTADFYNVNSIGSVVDNSVEWIGNALSQGRLKELGILKDGRFTDEWGIRWKGVGETRGQVESAPLSEPGLKGYSFPVPSQEVIGQMKTQADKHPDRYRVAKLGALWEQATFLRGMEELLVDLILHPGFVHELLDGIAEVLLANLEIYDRELAINCVWLSDDYGSQYDLLMSPEHWREFIRPRVKRICDAVHDAGYHFALHSDGAITSVIPDIADMGVDILNPVQAECVDVHRVKHEFGQRMTLWGGYGSQGTLVFGTPGRIRSEVNDLCDDLGAGGGFILQPGLSIQNEVPVENTVAFIDTAVERERGG